MIDLSNFISQQINESAKKNPLLKFEVKTNGSFKPGDVVLFREFWEKGDDSVIMIVAEDRGNRSLVSEVGTLSTLGSSKTLNNNELFKVGQVTINLDDKRHPVIPAESIAEAIKLCEDFGMDCEEIKKNERRRVGKW